MNNEEQVFEDWLNELKDNGYVIDFEFEPVSFTLADAEVITPAHKLRKVSYTPDFIIEWDKKAENLFYCLKGYKGKDKGLHLAKEQDGKIISYTDIKGVFANSRNTSAITFPIIQKLLYKNQDIFVNKIKPLDPKGLFHQTFTPASYFYVKNSKLPKLRITKFTMKTLQSYLNDKKSI